MYSSGTLRIHELTDEERAVYATLKPERLPEHVAIIMDGNGRWAGQRSLKRFLGHQQGAKSVQLVTETASRIGLPWLTLYAFSLENNLRRPRAEVSFLMRLLKSYLETQPAAHDGQQRAHALHRAHPRACPPRCRRRCLGRGSHGAQHRHHAHAGPELRRPLGDWWTPSAASPAEMKQKHLSPDRITEEDIHRHLYTAHMPDPDLLIRTSGEMRISNYLLWQIAYTEIFVTERLWPDFRGIHLLEAIADFQRRERRYGGLGEDCGEVEEDPDQIRIAAG